MKRDWDLIRDILLKVEDLFPTITQEVVIVDNFIDEKYKDTHSNEEVLALTQKINAHLKLLIEAGLIVGKCDHTVQYSLGKPFLSHQSAEYVCYCVCLTWKGYDFIEQIRNDSRWKKIYSFMIEKGAAFTIDTIMAVAQHTAKQFLGI